jgi:hypothetical protein
LKRLLSTLDRGAQMTKGGLLGSIEAAQGVVAEGVTRGWLPNGSTPASAPFTDADVTAAGGKLTAAQLNALIAMLTSTGTAALLTQLYQVRAS